MSNINDLLEALENAPGPKREPIQVGRLLAHCQQRCPEWFRECALHERGHWIRLMIDPRLKCDRSPGDGAE